MRSRYCIYLAAALLVPALGCARSVGVPGPQQLQAWAAYFDGDRGLSELREHGELFDRVSLFAYELGPEGSPVAAPNMAAMMGPFFELAEIHGFATWVTLVNDVRYDRDSVVAKDSTLIHELLADPDRRNAHAREVAARVELDGFSGLHLDYEQIPQSDQVPYQAFMETLRDELQQRGIGLEVVVEPARGPVPAAGSTSLVIMAYDLFGLHSGPGPRSTPAFVTGLGARATADRDSSAALAIAVGGFAWDADGEATAVDWSEAQLLAERASETQRDASGVPTAQTADNAELWFEDAASLLDKWRAAWTAGFRRLAIWRLGGNDERLFQLLRDLRRYRD